MNNSATYVSKEGTERVSPTGRLKTKDSAT